MKEGVARGAKRNKVLLGIISGVATKSFVVDLKICHGAAGLTFPSVAM
jgi:hypothetical protein